MSDISTKILPKKNKTKNEGIFYKEVQQTTVDKNGKISTKIIDKVFVIRYRDNGTERLVTIGRYSEGFRENYCKTKRNEFIALANNGELPPQVARRVKKKTLNEIAEKYYDYKKQFNRSNEQNRKKYKNRVAPILGNRPIHHISNSDVKGLQQNLSKKYSPKYINLIMGELRSIYKYAVEEKILTISPMIGIKNLKVSNRRERYLSKDEVKLLLEEVSEDEQLYTFMLLALTTGGRIGSICKLTSKDIDFERGRIKMHDEKNDEYYTTYFKSETLTELLKKKSLSKEPILYIKGKAESTADRVRTKSREVFNRLFNDENTPTKDRVVVHTLRHTFASNLAINGVPILTIQKLMNHKDINQTQRYAKLAPHSGEYAIEGLYSE